MPSLYLFACLLILSLLSVRGNNSKYLIGDPFDRPEGIIGGCKGTQFGCCPGGEVTAVDAEHHLCYDPTINTFIKFTNRRASTNHYPCQGYHPDKEVNITYASLSTGIVQGKAILTVIGTLKVVPDFYTFHYKVHLRCNGVVYDSLQTDHQDTGRVNPIFDVEDEPKLTLIAMFHDTNYTACSGQPLVFVKRVAKNNDNVVYGCDRMEFNKGWMEKKKRFEEYLRL